MVHHHHHIPRGYRHLFQDAITVTIPLEVTADLAIPMSRCRTKRIRKIRERFPELAVAAEPTAKSGEASNSSDEDDEDQTNDDSIDKNEKKTKKPKEKNQEVLKTQKRGVPQRHEYASMVDYLEAKYIQGVMVNDDKDDGGTVSSVEGNNSVYSVDSFINDTELKRDVVGQVLSQSIQTKLEEENESGDEFFVNVGNLEVKDSQHLMDYDINKDESIKKKAKKPATKKKRAASTESTKASPKKKKAKTTNSDGAPPKAKKTEQKPEAPPKSPKKLKEIEALKQKAKELDDAKNVLHDQVVNAIQNMTDQQLPRKKKTVKLRIPVPEGKKGGDSILFANPHVPNQRLKATVPQKSGPGETFVVSVPAPPPPEDTDNKFDRDFQDLLDDYSQAHDAWAQTQVLVHAAEGTEKDFSPHQERMNKFDELLKEFPSNLVVPVDAVYLRKVVRRARQNRNKRKNKTTVVAKPVEKATEDAEQEEEPEEEEVIPNTLKMNVPGMGRNFDQVEINLEDFNLKNT